MRWLLFAILCALLAACASAPRAVATATTIQANLRLAPAQLPAGAWQQQLLIEHGERRQRFQALLEVEPQVLRLVALVAEREAFRLRWDGRELLSEQADWLPQPIDAQRVLDDIQLDLAAAALLRAALAPGWTLHDSAERRELWFDGQLQVSLQRQPQGSVIEHPAVGLRLTLQSQRLDSP